jgi:hypothetical protein
LAALATLADSQKLGVFHCGPSQAIEASSFAIILEMIGY